MRRTFSLMLAMMLLICCTCLYTFSTDSTSLEDLANGAAESSEQQTQGGTGTSSQDTSREDRTQRFISGLNKAGDLASADIEGTEAATEWIRVIAAWIVQVLSYAITAFLAVRVVLDLTYIALPFTRGILANGYAGNAQAGAGGMPNSMVGGGMGQPGMGMGMGGMGGMGMGGMGMGGMGMRGGYGMNRMGGMGAMGGGMGATPGMNQQGNMLGRVQWVSNAALNAVASESTVGPDGKGNSPFKTYIHDMVIVLIMVPVLLVLAATGALTSLGFMLGNLLCDAIASIGDML